MRESIKEKEEAAATTPKGSPKSPSKAKDKKKETQGGLRSLMVTSPNLAEAYNGYCKSLKLPADPSVARLLECNHDELESLDLSDLMFTAQGFDVLMEVCQTLPNLQRLSFASTNFKSECVPSLVEMVQEHPSIVALDLSNNAGLGFAAAKLLLPMIKAHRHIIDLNVEGTSMAGPTKELIQKVLDSNRLRTELEGPRPKVKPPASPASSAGGRSPRSNRGMSPNAGDSFGVSLNEFGGESPAQSPTKLAEARDGNMKLMGSVSDQSQKIPKYIGKMKERVTEDEQVMNSIQNAQHKAVSAWNQQYQCAQNSEFTKDDLISQLDLSIDDESLEDLLEFYTLTRQAQYININPALNELLDSKTSRRRRTTIQQDLLKQIEGHGPNMEKLCGFVKTFVELMGQDKSAMAELKQMLEETNGQMMEFKARAARLLQDQKDMMEQEDLRSAETKFEEYLEVEEQIIDVVLFRLSQLLDKGSKQQLLENLEKCDENARKCAEEAKAQNAETKARVDEDIVKLEEKQTVEQKNVKKRGEAFEEAKAVIDTKLEDNLASQEKIWVNLQQSISELEALGKDRTALVNGWVGKVEEHAVANMESDAMIKVSKERVKLLECLKHDCNSCEGILKNLSDFYDRASVLTKQLVNSTSSEGDNLVLEEQRNYLNIFREYYMQLGEWMFKKSKRLEEVDRMIRSCEFQIEFCKETLDPDLPRYRNQLKEMQQRRGEMATKVEALEIRGDEKASMFLPHEQALRKAGEQFDSPLLLMHEHVVESRARVLMQRTQFLNRDKEELVEKEAMQIDELAASAKSARDTGAATLLKGAIPKPPGSSGREAAAPRPAQSVAAPAGF